MGRLSVVSYERDDSITAAYCAGCDARVSYSYGMSILNTHILAGALVVLTRWG